MMRSQPVFQDPARLHRLGYILVCAQSVFGGILLIQTWQLLTHGIFAALLATVLLCIRVHGKRRGARVIARVLVGLFWLIAAALCVQFADAVTYSWGSEHVARLQDGVCWFGGLALCYLTPAAATVMLYSGEHTTAYDRVVACICQPAAALVAAVSVFTDAGIPWTLDGRVLPYVWLALTVFSALVIWLCARVHTEAQKQAVIRAKERRALRIANAKK